MNLIDNAKNTITNIVEFDLSEYLITELLEFIGGILGVLEVVVLEVGTIIAVALVLLELLGNKGHLKKSNYVLSITLLVKIILAVLV